MDTFLPSVSAVATPDPSKHVNYTLGMVLGVDDFTQEFAYLSGRDQWLARDTIGYGTVSGLKVRIKKDDKGPGVLVEPGAAVSPRGQLIRVTPAQCAYLNPWLAANKEKLSERVSVTSPPPGGGDLRLYVVLCYRDCKTEMTPVPGEPCRSEDELMAASRLADDFRLELRFEAPNQQEENALRDFVQWLSQIEISDVSATTLEDFEAAVRRSAHLSSPPTSPPNFIWSPPDFMYGSPPDSLSIPSARACEYLRAAFRIWATELRPLWQPNWFSEWQCCDQKTTEVERPKEECLLLAELNVPLHRVALTDEIKVDDLREIVVDEERRPFLIHSRLLQEWLLCGRTNGGGGMQAATGVVVFKTTGSGKFVAESDFIDPGLGGGPLNVQVAFVRAPDELVFGDVPRLQRALGAGVKIGTLRSTFRVIANTFETPFDSEFSVRWFASRSGVERRTTEVVLTPQPEEPEL